MLSVVTPTYNTPPHILARTFASLKAQTFTDWEWVVYDDSTDDRVWRQLWGFCADERYNIRPLRGMSNIGSIGKVKRTAFMAAEGDVLVELDHDDELTPDCLEELYHVFQSDIKFAYSDWSEHFDTGGTGRYPEGWAFGYGGEYRVDEDWVMVAPPINRTTIGHIVSSKPRPSMGRRRLPKPRRAQPGPAGSRRLRTGRPHPAGIRLGAH